MKKISTYFFIILLSVIVFLLGFGYKTTSKPNAYYQVYLDNESIGLIESKKELEDYINKQADAIKENLKEYNLKLDAIDTFKKYESNVNIGNYSLLEKANYLIANRELYNLTDLEVENLNFYKNNYLYNYLGPDVEQMRLYVHKNSIYEYVDDVYSPEGTEIKKVYTYDNNLTSVEQIYKEIMSKKTSTISGYKFTIKRSEEEGSDIEIYTIDKKIFSDAIEDLITIFVDDVKYEAYKNDQQTEIVTTGSIIENIYVQEEITYKAVNIPVEEKIYTSSKDLSAYLLYGDKFEEKKVKVKTGDSIESLAFENQISVQEFLIFNSQYTSRDNLLVTGTDVTISTVDPKIKIVVESYEVVDKETDFEIIEQHDKNLTQGSIVVAQQGENGLERVSQNVKSVNGEISYVDPEGKEVLKSSIPKIINIGTKYVPNVGSTASWGWPTNSGYTFSSYYGYRLQLFGEGNFHSGIDIAGTGYGSNVYAANNGTIVTMEYVYNYGYHIIINHNNGYYTVYAHMKGFAPNLSVGSTVSRGQIIGYVGDTGWATGPHLHYEIRTCARYACTTNPLNYYR
ncbi:MAG: peptidoglycan DD-metalloendopeptidase family protein [Bacilli bacterium]|nr:peptidoglycan DD-metalloendopeptidase family protein [Bacilli bacterium]